MVALTSFRHTGPSFADLVPYAGLVDNGVILLKDGSLMKDERGVSPLVITVLIILVGVLLVAIGTSLPELVTVILSRLRGHDDVGVGTLIGSNLFNGLAIVGVAGSIHPIAVPFSEVAVTLASGLFALFLLTRSIIPATAITKIVSAVYTCFLFFSKKSTAL